MDQAILQSKENIEFKKVPIPEINENEVLLNVKSIGVCGSDVSAYADKHPFINLPVVPGHEVAAVIEKIGEAVRAFKIGDIVTIRPQRYCGHCYQCREGKYNICEKIEVLGCLSTGAASNYYAIEQELVYKLPKDITYDEGTLVEPLSVAVHAVNKSGGVTGKNVLVIGAGTIGNLVTQVAKANGAKNIITSDVADYKLDVLKEIGIDNVVNAKNEDLEEKLLEIYGKDKADVIFDCVATDITINQSLRIARKGTNIVLVGVPGNNIKVDIGYVQDHELNLIGTLCYRDDDYVKAINLIKNNEVNVSKLVTKVFPFKKYNEAFQYIDDNKDTVIKAVINI